MQTSSLQIMGAQTPGVGVGVKCACEIQYQQLICHTSRLSTPGDAQTTEAAWCRQHAPWLHQTASVVRDSGESRQTNRLRQTESRQLTALIVNKLPPNGNYSAPGLSVSSVDGPPSVRISARWPVHACTSRLSPFPQFNRSLSPNSAGQLWF